MKTQLTYVCRMTTSTSFVDSFMFQGWSSCEKWKYHRRWWVIILPFVNRQLYHLLTILSPPPLPHPHTLHGTSKVLTFWKEAVSRGVCKAGSPYSVVTTTHMITLVQTVLGRENVPASPFPLCPGGCRASDLNKGQYLLFISLRRKLMIHTKGLFKHIGEGNIY